MRTAAEERAYQNLRKSIARDDLLAFTQYNWPPYMPPYQAGWIHKYLCRELELFDEAVNRKESPRLMVVWPPQYGKSELVSRNYPAWTLGKNPNQNIITASFSSERSDANSKDVQRIIESPSYRELFPGIELATKPADGWCLKGHERFTFRSAGIQGGITGFPAQRMILDDLLKNWDEANSPIILEKVRAELGASIKSRLAEGAGIVFITTRWNEQDPAWWFLETMRLGGFQWRYLWYPQFAIESSTDRAAIGDFRKVGETLCPERFSQEYSEKVRDDYKAAGQYIIFLTANQGIPQPTIGMCYFNTEGDEPEDAMLRRYEARVKQPKRFSFRLSGDSEKQVIVDGKSPEGWSWIQDEGGLWRIWEFAIAGFNYIFTSDAAYGADAGGLDTDYSVIRVWRMGILSEVSDFLHTTPKVTIGEVHKPCLVAMFRGRPDTMEFERTLVQAGFYFNYAYQAPERDGVGLAVITGLKKDYPFHLILRERTIAKVGEEVLETLGYKVSVNKESMLADWKDDLRRDLVDIFDGEGWVEYRHFVNRGGKLGAGPGFHDDIPMADMILHRAKRDAPMLWPGNLKKLSQREVEYQADNEETGY